MRRSRFPRRVVPLLGVCIAAAMLILATAAIADRTNPNAKDSPTPTRKTGGTGEPTSQGTASPANPAPAGEAARRQAMEQMMKAAAPGPAHEKLKAYVGDWKATVKTWTGSAQPTVSEGTATMQMILGGRFLEQRFRGTFMNQPFEGYGLTGYDNQKGVYDMMWVDNSSTGIMSGEGSMDDAAKTLTMHSTMPGPDGKPVEVRTVMKTVDPSSFVYSMYAPMNGQDQLVMEITYKRP